MEVKALRDGWHMVAGWEVYVEDGRILRGVMEDCNGSRVPCYPMRRDRRDARVWDRETLTPAAFRAGLARGTVRMFG